MKVAVVYNRDSKRVINLFGIPNREKYGLQSIKRITDALKAHGHQVMALEGDKDLIDRLEEFMPRVMKGERPGLVFNLSYGIQGQARYTHVPGILEMVGIPYVGSGPLAHSLALDKVVAKMIFRQHGLPTPDFAVLDSITAELPELRYPLIVKPKNEAVSFGIRVVNTEDELRAAAAVVLDAFGQPALVEQYIEGREINVGLLGNAPPEALQPVELSFGDEGPRIYTLEDKKGTSGREIGVICPAPISEELTREAQEISRKAFEALGCYDCARVDMRLDAEGRLTILELNSLPSLGLRGSYVAAAAAGGLDFPALVNRLVEVASARYFGTPTPPDVASRETDPAKQVFSFLTARRDKIEKRLREWTAISSRSTDPIGVRQASRLAEERMRELGMTSVEDLGNEHVWTLETRAGLAGGTLFLVHTDVPLLSGDAVHMFRREPETLHGEGIATSRAPLVMLEFSLRALKHVRRLGRTPLGVLVYSDEGLDCRYSAEMIRKAAKRAGRVLVLRPGNAPDRVVTQRRGLRTYHLIGEGRVRRLGQTGQRPDALTWFCGKVAPLGALSDRRKRLSVTVSELRSAAFPLLLPHRVEARLQLSYLDSSVADAAEQEMRGVLGKGDARWSLELLSDRPPMPQRKGSTAILEELRRVAGEWEIPVGEESSVWPSAAGLVPESVPVLCGLGPVGENLSTAQEAVHRISLVQRTLLLAQLLCGSGPK